MAISVYGKAYIAHLKLHMPLVMKKKLAIEYEEDTTVMPCKTKRQYLITSQVSRYCVLALQSRVYLSVIGIRVPSHTVLVYDP